MAALAATGARRVLGRARQQAAELEETSQPRHPTLAAFLLLFEEFVKIIIIIIVIVVNRILRQSCLSELALALDLAGRVVIVFLKQRTIVCCGFGGRLSCTNSNWPDSS